MFSTRIPILVAATLFCGSAASAQDSATANQELPSADEVIDAYIENTGGKEAWSNLKSMQTDAILTMGYIEFTAKVTTARPNKLYVEIDLQGQPLITGYDGNVGWQINPFSHVGTAAIIPKAQAEQMAMPLEPTLFNYTDKGCMARIIGITEVSGALAYDLTLVCGEADTEHYYFDLVDILPVMYSRNVVDSDGNTQLSETYLSNYQSVGNLILPMINETKIDSVIQQKMILSNMTLNPTIDESMFTVPKAVINNNTKNNKSTTNRRQ